MLGIDERPGREKSSKKSKKSSSSKKRRRDPDDSDDDDEEEEEAARRALRRTAWSRHTPSPMYVRHIEHTSLCEKIIATYTHAHTQPVNGPLSETAWVGRYQKKHSPTDNHPAHQKCSLSASSIYYDP